MERVFKKFLGKWWFAYRRPEIARLIFRQICEDARMYLRRVMSSECSLMDLEHRRLTRSKSMPCLNVGYD